MVRTTILIFAQMKLTDWEHSSCDQVKQASYLGWHETEAKNAMNLPKNNCQKILSQEWLGGFRQNLAAGESF